MPPKKNKRIQQHEAKSTAAKANNKDYNDDDRVPDHLICPVCMEVPEKVMLTDDCGHLLCESCTNELLKKKTVKCPVCNKEFTEDTVRHSLFNQRQVDALPIECPSEGCDWKKERSELPAHLKRCPLATIPCPHDGCKATVKRKDLAAHEAECPESTVECPNRKAGCKERMKRKEVGGHRRRCEHEMVSCPNKGCDVKMLRKAADDHQDVCPEAMVRCAHAEDGCKARMKRKNLEEHMEANKFEHLQLQVVALRAENAKLKDEHKLAEETHRQQIGTLTLALKEYNKGERCVVKLPVNENGSATLSNEFTLFGEQWKLRTDKHQGFRTMYLETISAVHYCDSTFSLTLLSRAVGNVSRSATPDMFVASWGWAQFIKDGLHNPYVQNGCFFVEVWVKEAPRTQGRI